MVRTEVKRERQPQTSTKSLKEANANRVMSHRRQFLAELVVATIVADGTEGNLALLCFTLCLASLDLSQLAQDPA